MFVSEIIDQVAEVLGRCDREKALRRISDAVIALQDEGDWNANIGALDIVTFNDGNTVTLPREVETPLAVAINNHPAFMRDEFYRYHLNGDGLTDGNVVPWAWDDQGVVPNFMDIGTPGPIVAYCEILNDEGRIVRVLGYDANGREIRSQLEDGEWISGVRYPLVKVAGIPTSQPLSYSFRRLISTSPSFKFGMTTPHRLVTGAEMQVAIQTGTFPEPLINGAFYFIRVENDEEVSVFATRLDAQTNQNRIDFTSFNPGSTATLTENRPVSVRTQFQTVGASQLVQNSRVMFSAAILPTPLLASKIYRAVPTGSSNFLIYDNEEDADLGENVINVSDSGATVRLRTLQEIFPVTKLVFGVPHNVVTGDQITVENSGGSLPEPLLPGVAYFVRVINANELTLHENLADTTTGANVITLTTVGTGTNSILKIIPASVAGGGSSVVTTTLPHNLSAPSGSGATAAAATTSNTVTSINVTNGGTGYNSPPVVQITGGGGTGATAEAIVSGGIVTAVRVITGGTGYTSAPAIQFIAQGGSLVRFTTNGTLPQPITSNTVYVGETTAVPTQFTLKTTFPENVRITSTGSGQLYVAISRAFSISFLPQWKLDASNLVTGNSVQVYSEGILPTTAPSQINPGTLYFVRKINNQQIELYDTAANALAPPPSTTGQISAISAGDLKVFVFTERDVTAVPRDNYLDISFTSFLANQVQVKFETTGTLPSPLVAGVTYQVTVVDDKISLTTTGNVPVVIGTIGSGTHKMVIQRVMSVVSPTELDVHDHDFETGAAVNFENEGGDLPSPLTTSNTYYLRSVGPDSVEVYLSEAQALNVLSTAGRVVFTDSGEGTSRAIQSRVPVQFATISAVEKDETDGYVRVYAWDTSRSNNVALIGDYHPTETVPTYRRIRVMKNATSVRIKYRRRPIELLSERDFINLDSRMAVLMMVQSQELLFKKFVDEAERYRIIAVEYLNKRNRALDGPRAPTVQINGDVMGVPGDWMD
jgi:hypothetical protein